MTSMPQPIPYQGSKRTIAPQILRYFPKEVGILFEPFAGSAALSIRAAYEGRARQFYLSDLNQPLMDLLRAIIEEPERMADHYEEIWLGQLADPRGYYDTVRDEFNRTQRPELLLYLLARCVKASVRYNSNGDFNQSPDNRRLGRRPQSMRQEIFAVSALLRGKTTIRSDDYRQILAHVDPTYDVLYMDPPYQGTSAGRDNRYVQGLPPDEFAQWLERLSHRQIMYLVSYDGRRGETVYGDPLPESLGLYQVEIEAGRSTQSTLLGREDVTTESLYLSSTLVKRLKSEGRWGHIRRVTQDLQPMDQLGLGLR